MRHLSRVLHAGIRADRETYGVPMAMPLPCGAPDLAFTERQCLTEANLGGASADPPGVLPSQHDTPRTTIVLLYAALPSPRFSAGDEK